MLRFPIVGNTLRRKMRSVSLADRFLATCSVRIALNNLVNSARVEAMTFRFALCGRISAACDLSENRFAPVRALSAR